MNIVLVSSGNIHQHWGSNHPKLHSKPPVNIPLIVFILIVVSFVLHSNGNNNPCALSCNKRLHKELILSCEVRCDAGTQRWGFVLDNTASKLFYLHILPVHSNRWVVQQWGSYLIAQYKHYTMKCVPFASENNGCVLTRLINGS